MGTDLALDVADDLHRVLVRRLIDFDAPGRSVHVDEAVAERPRHAGLIWAMTVLGALHRGKGRVDAGAERAEAMGSGGLTLMKTASSGRIPRLKSSGMSERKIGT